MSYNKKITFGQSIRRIKAGEISPIYSLYGEDSFLEDYFINEIQIKFLKNKNAKKSFSLDQDSNHLLFEELSSISLFEEKRLIIVREIKKIRTELGRKELIQYIQNPKKDLILILISAEFDLKNVF